MDATHKPAGPIINGLLDSEISAYLQAKLTPATMAGVITRVQASALRLLPALVDDLSKAAATGVTGVDANTFGNQLSVELLSILLPVFQGS